MPMRLCETCGVRHPQMALYRGRYRPWHEGPLERVRVHTAAMRAARASHIAARLGTQRRPPLTRHELLVRALTGARQFEAVP